MSEIEKGQVLVFNESEDKSGINLFQITGKAKGKSKLLFLAGKPLNERKFKYGPFVVETRGDAEKAITDFRFGKNGFEGSSSWTSNLKKELERHPDTDL